MIFTDRHDAAEQLTRLLSRRKIARPVVLALPRGGVVLGAIVAKRLKVPLGLVLVRKIGHMYSPEFAIGAIAEDDEPIFDEAERASVDPEWLKHVVDNAKRQIAHRREIYFPQGTTRPIIKGRSVILVDDGVATGLTMLAAVRHLKHQGAKQVIVAVPVAAADSVLMLEKEKVEVLVLADPITFTGAVGNHYRIFEQVSDEKVIRLLRGVNQPRHLAANGVN